MERRFNLLAGLSSILSLVIVAIPFLYQSDTGSSYVQSAFAFVVVLLMIVLFLWMKKYDIYMRSEIRKEELIKVARQHIESATKKIIFFSNDLSWASDYADAIRGRISSKCTVVVVHKKSTDEKVMRNSAMLQLLGAKIVELEEDHLLRATLIDPDDILNAKLFVAHKKRKPGSAIPLPSGESGTDRDFHYECAVYQNGADKILIRSLVQIANKVIPIEGVE